jgi:hypothetical protein
LGKAPSFKKSKVVGVFYLQTKRQKRKKRKKCSSQIKNGKWSQKEKEKKVFFDFLANFL